MLISVGAALMASAAAGAPAWAWQAQPESNGVVGPAEIRDFSLPGQRPAPEPTPAPSPPADEAPAEPVTIPAPDAPGTPAPAQPRPAPPRAQPPATATPGPTPAPAPAREQPQAGDEPEERIVDRERLPEPDDVRSALPDPTSADTPLPTSDAESAPETAPTTPGPGAAPEEEGSSWLFPLLAALALIGGAVAFLKFRRREEEAVADVEPVAEPAPLPEPDPAPVTARPPAPPATPPRVPTAAPEPSPEPAAPPEPVAAGHVGLVMRPWLELHFRPARATATDGGASVQYDAVIRNVGNAPARNVRLAARMFNAGPQLDEEVAAFFAMDIAAPDGAPLTILPRTEVALTSVVNMPREEMREIKVQGRSLFIPTVAFNLLYEWGRDKVGQTCSSHVVGREPEQPSEKMAPFRLDLGPRVYRSVGQRPSALARAL